MPVCPPRKQLADEIGRTAGYLIQLFLLLPLHPERHGTYSPRRARRDRLLVPAERIADFIEIDLLHDQSLY